MPDQEFTAFVSGFIRTNWDVELLITLKRDAERSWGPAELVTELRASASLVADCLGHFERRGLVLKDGAGARYAPAGPTLARLCDVLETTYRERPVYVLNLISKPRDPVRSLADAFKFRDKGE